jgi:Ca2+/H+ antiporter
LNASFGNIIEIIVGITALLQGEVHIVQNAVRSLPPSSVLHRMLTARRCLVLFCTISSLY